MTVRQRGRAGQAMRLRRLRRTNGLCEMCRDAGRIEEATRVDHITPLALGGDDVDENTRNLCVPHHREVTAEQFGFDAPIGAKGCDARGVPTDPSHPWSRSAIGG